jgi:hypothetical protein
MRNIGRRFTGSLKNFSPQRTQRTQRKLKWVEKQKLLKLGWPRREQGKTHRAEGIEKYRDFMSDSPF